MKKVKVNAWYVYNPVGLDRCNPPYGITDGILKQGDRVKVVNKQGCPKANTMGHCYIVNKDNVFCGLVCVNSLQR